MKENSIYCLVSILAFLAIGAQGSDQNKPIFHLSAKDGKWINDPNGPYYDYVHKEYHLFAQYDPSSYEWGNMSWFHWTSKDLLHWEEQPVALYNDMSYDIGGAFSGSALLMNDGSSKSPSIPMLIYTCVDVANKERQCIATATNISDPHQTQWQKSAQNPIIDFTTLPSPYNSVNFRDPAIWPKSSGHNTGYWVAMAAEIDSQAHIVVYDCSFTYDAKHTDFDSKCTYYSTLWSTSTIPMVECPDFYPVPSTTNNNPTAATAYVLKYSKMEDRREYYEIGTYDESKGVFMNQETKVFEYDYGLNNHFYASKTLSVSSNAQGNGVTRRILWGWLPEQHDDTMQSVQTWSGVMSLPREVSYSTLWQALLFQPIQELQSLRNTHTHYTAHLNNLIINGHDDPTVTAGEYLIPLPIATMAMEIHAIFHVDVSVIDTPSDCAVEVGFLSRTSAFPTDVIYESVTKTFPERYTKHTVGIKHTYTEIEMFTAIDVTHSGGNTIPNQIQKTIPGDVQAWLDAAGNHNNQNKEAYGIDINMIFYVDHSVLELYVLDGISTSTTRVYPDSTDVGLAAYVKTCDNTVQRVVLHSVDAWELNSI